MMVMTEPVETNVMVRDGADPMPWKEGLQRLENGETYWFATRRPDGRPHVRPVLAVGIDGCLYVAANTHTRKARNLLSDPRCTICTTGPGIDLVVEGSATKVTNEVVLQRIADIYHNKYGWQVTVRNGAFYGEGAPTAGPPPYELYEIILGTVFCFPSTEDITPTRWRF
jgi:hypothetical protein